MSRLAILGGAKAVNSEPGDMFKWPIVNQAMENGILQVLRDGNMSGTDITKKFEQAYADWIGVKYALAHSSGTASLQCAMYGVGVGTGDEIICPSITYWASCAQALTLGASVVFADIDPVTLCIDPNDIKRHITPRTKAIVVVHYLSMPADMDPIMAIAKKHNLKVIEDVSHAHGALYKGKMAGTFGDAAGYSLMSGKSFAIGEGGMLTTNNREIYERAIVFGHYERHGEITDEKLKAGADIPWGGYKYRMHQMSSIVGLEQLKKYPAEMAEINKAMNYFWDLLEGVPGLDAHRPAKNSGSTKGGWYSCHGIYKKEELGGLSINRFCDAVNAEGGVCGAGCNAPLHSHPLFHTVDVYGAGKPTNIANLPPGIDIRQGLGALPVSDGIQAKVFHLPWFKHFRKEIIEEHAAAYRKAAENYQELLPGDTDHGDVAGKWALSARKG
jgi:dTDP-4-amino-4,6-dideoxygalactose transaminase